MGKLILCSGVRTKRPYGFDMAGIRVYSIEELCFYLYHHVYFIDEEMFTDALIEWIDTELKLPERADKLRILKEQKADIKTMVTVILCSADYYTELEIKYLLKTLDEMIGMPLIKRSCIKANNLLQNHKFSEAAEEYNRIISSKDAASLTPEDYGDILHNLAIAKINITGLADATELFHQAYERNHREESLRQYLYSLKLSNNDTLYKEKLEEYQINGEQIEHMNRALEEKSMEAENSDLMSEIKLLKQLKAQGNMSKYHKKTNEMIDQWKARVRQF